MDEGKTKIRYMSEYDCDEKNWLYNLSEPETRDKQLYWTSSLYCDEYVRYDYAAVL